MIQQLRIGILVFALIVAPTMSKSEDPAEGAFMDAKMRVRDSMPID